MHGFALNVDPDMSYFTHMNPCGIVDRDVASLVELVGGPVSIEEVIERLVPHFADVFGYAENEVQLGAFTRGQGRPRTFEVDEMVVNGTFSPERHDAIPVMVGGRLAGEPERPDWMKVRANLGDEYRDLKRLMRDLDLNTVCEEAGCPNIYECWASGTATLMILGDRCTRACSFCNVTTGKPTELDVFEPFRAAEAVERMGLAHAVITSVNRDDLDDGGSGIFAATIHQIRERLPECDVEVLIPDFKGVRTDLETVMAEKPAVLNHNTETVLPAPARGSNGCQLWPLAHPPGQGQVDQSDGCGEVRADRRHGRDARGDPRSAGRPQRHRRRHRHHRPILAPHGSPSCDPPLRPS